MKILALGLGLTLAAAVLALAACGSGDGGLDECYAFVGAADACGGLAGFDRAWCDSFQQAIEAGVDCSDLFATYLEAYECSNGVFQLALGQQIPSGNCNF